MGHIDLRQLEKKLKGITDMHKLIDLWLEAGDIYSLEQRVEKYIFNLLTKEKSLFQIASFWLRVPPRSQPEKRFEERAKIIVSSLSPDVFFEECSRIERELKQLPPFLQKIKKQKEEFVPIISSS
jgi:hypothetical protein